MKSRTLILIGVFVALVLAGVVSYYASGSPDGLERVSEDHGFAHEGRDSAASRSPMSDYSVRGVDDERMSVGIAGIVGTLVVFGVAGGGFWLLRRRQPHDG